MKWVTDKEVIEFINHKSYDIRKSKNGRWIDQKCTADVVTVIADCIYNYVSDGNKEPFSSVDVWHNKYTVENVESMFKKPNPDGKKAKNEYDKFFQQPMEMLSYAGVLKKIKKGNRNYYSIANINIITYLMMRERNSLTFLQVYIEKVLKDSGIYYIFNEFFDDSDKVTYLDMKLAFKDFIIRNTPINGQTECFRIFTKVLNPLAYKKDTRGTEKGRISKNKITYDMLMYNRDNFRDIYSHKPKNMTRKEYEEQLGIVPNINHSKYQSQKAKRVIRAFNDTYRESKSEVKSLYYTNDIAINIHHIFPEAEYPEISMYLENLIALTPTQHFNYAHPLGNTHIIDPGFQQICLLAKASGIEANIISKKEEVIYEFGKFMFVLYIGFDNEVFNDIEDMDFTGAVNQINLSYS